MNIATNAIKSRLDSRESTACQEQQPFVAADARLPRPTFNAIVAKLNFFRETTLHSAIH